MKNSSRNTALGLERIVFFSDAVMAIAITLLAIEFRVPDISPELAVQQLPAAVDDLAPKITGFVISFVIIGIYWLSHHRYFEYINNYDNRLILLNLLYLFFIALLPASTGLAGEYPYVSLALILYAANVTALGLMAVVLWRYATFRHRLVDPELDATLIRDTLRRGFIAPAIFLISIPVAVFKPQAAVFVWWLAIVPVAIRFISRRYAKHEDANVDSEQPTES